MFLGRANTNVNQEEVQRCGEQQGERGGGEEVDG